MINMFQIDDYDVFVFDFDGTIMDTEYTHYLSWKKTIQTFVPDFNITEDEYFKHVHHLDTKTFQNYLYEKYNLTNYDELYKKKSEFYKEEIKTRCHIFIGNFEMFLYKITSKLKKKDLIIVTNSSISSINIFLNLYPQLNIFKIFTKENFTKRKPDPECYQKIAEIYKGKRIIGFEDSLVGVHALIQVPEIIPFHIKPSNYYYNNLIKEKYNIHVIENYNIFN